MSSEFDFEMFFNEDATLSVAEVLSREIQRDSRRYASDSVTGGD